MYIMNVPFQNVFHEKRPILRQWWSCC